MTNYNEGWTNGCEKARQDLSERSRTASWAKVRLDALHGNVARTDYGQGYLDGYRSTLANAVEPKQGPIGGDLMGLRGDCEGGECRGIERLCSKHSAQYQARYGRASNE